MGSPLLKPVQPGSSSLSGSLPLMLGLMPSFKHRGSPQPKSYPLGSFLLRGSFHSICNLYPRLSFLLRPRLLPWPLPRPGLQSGLSPVPSPQVRRDSEGSP